MADKFAQLDDLHGTATDEAHQGWLEVSSYTKGLNGKMVYVTLPFGPATIHLQNASDRVFHKLTIDTVVKGDAAKNEKSYVFSEEFKNLVVDTFQPGGGASEPLVTVGFEYDV